MTGIEVINVHLDKLARDPADKYIGFRWSCAKCGKVTSSAVAKYIVEAWRNAPQPFMNRECMWCKAMNVIEVRVH